MKQKETERENTIKLHTTYSFLISNTVAATGGENDALFHYYLQLKS